MRNLLIVTLLWWCSGAFAQTKSPQGRIVSPDTLPVAHASVVVYRQADSTATRVAAIADPNGIFELPEKDYTGHYLRISCLGYETADRALPLADTLIVLTPREMEIDGVEVVGRRPFSQIAADGILYRIKNSVLAHEASAKDVLSKIPGLSVSDDGVHTIYGDTPAIYVNGKKLYDPDELKSIDPTRIQSIKLIDNPGAEFASEEKAVIEIKTAGTNEGFDLFWAESASRSRFWSHSHALYANYDGGKLFVSGNVEYEDRRRKSRQEQLLQNESSDIQENRMDMEAIRNANKALSLSLSVNYDINERHSIGTMYSWRHNTLHSLFSLHTRVFRNSILEEEISGTSAMNHKGDGHLVNLFYIGKPGEKTELKLFADYFGNDTRRFQTVDERYAQETTPRRTQLANPSVYNLYATRGILNHAINGKHAIAAGAEFSHVSGRGRTDYAAGEADNSAYTLSECKGAGFADYTLNLDVLTLKAGIRFEHIRAEYANPLAPEENSRRTYNHVLPSLRLNSSLGKIQSSLSYSARISRPLFSRLGSYSSYMNAFQREEGNPRLKPERTHTVQWLLGYGHFNLALSYNHTRDYMAMDITNDPQQPDITIFTWNNYRRFQKINLFASYSRRFRFYEPNYSAAFIKPFFSVGYKDSDIDMNTPTWFVCLDNYFHIARACTLNVNYTYTSGGVAQIYTLGATHRIDVSVDYRLFKDRLTLRLGVQDVLDKEIDRLTTRINNTYIRNKENNDRRCVKFSASWRFNTSRKSYKGELAGENEMNRF